jgi:hypothetical protein
MRKAGKPPAARGRNAGRASADAMLPETGGKPDDIGQRFKSPGVMNPHAKLRNVTTIEAQVGYP